MPKAKRYTEKRFVMLTPAQARQLERLSQHQEVLRTGVDPHGPPPALRPADGIRPPTGAVRWQGTFAIEVTRGGIIRRSSAACFPRPRAACRGRCGSLTSCWTERTLEPGAVAGGVGTPLLFVAQRLESNAGLTAPQP